MKYKYLFDFLNKNAGYFTVLGFLGAFLSVSFFLPVLKETNLEILNYLLQGTLLILFLFLFFPLLNELKKSEAKSIKWFQSFMMTLFLILAFYLFFGYRSLLIGASFIIALGWGMVLFSRVVEIITNFFRNKTILFGKNFWNILFFILIIFANYLFFLWRIKEWGTKFTSISSAFELTIFINNLIGYVFIGFLAHTFFLIMGFILKLFEKFWKKLKLGIVQKITSFF